MHKKDYYILLSILETIDKIFRFSSNYSNAEEFYSNERDFDATIMNFVVLGENVGKLDQAFKDKNDDIDWDKIYGLRNIIAHHYFGINADIIWEVINDDLPKLKNNVSKLIE